MPVKTDPQLAIFNTLTLQIQDDAYTLAYYLLGDDARAAEATQKAFAGLYHQPALKLDRFRWEVLQRVLLQCRTARAGLGIPRTASFAIQDDLASQLTKLGEHERAVAVLVDVLKLSYDEAAVVLGCSKKDASRWLAQARFSLAQPSLVG